MGGFLSNPNSRGKTLVFILVLWASCLLFFGVALAQETTLNGKTYVKSDGKWYQIYQGKRFEVSNVISVKFKPAVQPNQITAFTAQMGAQVIRSNRLGIYDIKISAGSNPLEAVKAYQGSGLVEFAETNTYGEYTITPNDALFNNQWGLHNYGQTGGTSDADMDGPEAWDVETGSNSVVIAVLDSGTEIDHQDLAFNMWKNTGEIPGNGVDDDLNGFIDDYDGWDFHNNNNDPRGTYYHGTFVAGIVAAATNNGIGVAGVAGGWSPGSQGCLIMPLGIGDDAPNSAILDDAILYAVDNGAQVITLSLTVGPTTAINNALEDAWNNGLFIDCSSGNANSSVGYPANHARVMAVGATDHNDNRAGFSNYGPELEVVAPGVNIWSTHLNDAYDTGNGTSFAAPQVAGLAGLILSLNPGMTNADIRQRIQDTAEDQVGNPVEDTPGRDNYYGFGRINLFAALSVEPQPDISVSPTIFNVDVQQGQSTTRQLTITNNGGSTLNVSQICDDETPCFNTGASSKAAVLMRRHSPKFSEVRKALGAKPRFEVQGDVIKECTTGPYTVMGLHYVPSQNVLYVVAEDESGNIYKYDENCTVTDTLPGPAPSMNGITFDGQYLWVSDFGGLDGNVDMLYKIDPNTGAVINFWDLRPQGILGILGIAWDGQYLWVSSYLNSTIFKVDINGNVLESFGVLWENTGLDWDGQYLISTDDWDGVIYRVATDGTVVDSMVAPGGDYYDWTAGITCGGTPGQLWVSNYWYDFLYLVECYWCGGTIEEGDQYEPDNTPAQAQSLSQSPVVQNHTIHTGGDVDWFVISLQSGDNAVAETSNLGGTNPDTVIEVYDQDCNLIAEDDDSGGDLASRILWTAAYTGDYYVKARSYYGASGQCNDQGGGPAYTSYTVTIQWESVEPICVNDAPWLSQNPISGSVPAGGQMMVDVTFDATGLGPGSYCATIHVQSNDPNEAVVDIPVTMTVTDEQCLEDDSGSLDIAHTYIGPGQIVQVLVRIQNAPNAVESIGFQMAYNTGLLQYQGYTRGDCVTNFDFFDVNEQQPGLLVAGGFEANPAEVIPQGANCTVVNLEFTVIDCVPGEVYPVGSLQNLLDDLAGWASSGGCAECGSCDVNGDGDITPQDALCAFQKYLGICPTACGPCEQIFCDVNGDGDCTPGDALEIFREYLGIRPNACSP